MAYTTIDDPSAHFQIATYTGNGSANHAITNDGLSDLQPDFVWIKNRDAADSHCIFDSTRGVTEVLHCDTPSVETTDADTLDSFASDGFQVDADDKVNTNTEAYVAWQWKANGGSRSTFAEDGDNPGGGYQVNTTAGFSIVDYTGTGANGTIAHGLGAIPHCMIVKNRSLDDLRYWAVYNIGLDFPTDDLVYLDESSAGNDHDPTWNDTAPTSSVFTVGTYHSTNEDGESFVAYLWTPIQGYSKFGSYTGNASTDGTFVYLGFKPAWLLIKRTDGSGNWILIDTKRDTHNVSFKDLNADRNAAEGGTAYYNMDLLSNGVKFRNLNAETNGSGTTYVYMAFAEQPFVTSGGVPCTAR